MRFNQWVFTYFGAILLNYAISSRDLPTQVFFDTLFKAE